MYIYIYVERERERYIDIASRSDELRAHSKPFSQALIAALCVT